MGLAEDLNALQQLREKGEMTESAYAAARDAAINTHAAPNVTITRTTPSKGDGFGRGVSRVLIPLLLVVLAIWFFMRVNLGSRPASQAIATIVRAPVTLTDEVENLPAHSWKADGLNLPYGGTVEVNLEVMRGNPVDVFLTTPDQLDAMKREDWSNVRALTNFNAEKTKLYRRTDQLQQGSYYLVMRDTSLGILSASASDISVKVRLNP